MRIVIGLVVVLLGVSAWGAADADSVDTLFLRDGSILQGIIAKDSQDQYHVYNPLFGEVSLDAGTVLYMLPKKEDPPLLTETHVVVDQTWEVISTFLRDIPEPKAESEQFNLLIPGKAESVYAEGVSEVPFRNRAVGDLSIITIRFAHIQSSAQRLLITSRQQGLLERTDSGGVRFQVKHVLDEGGGIRVVLEHPQAWEVESISPEPAHRFEGLIVWEKSLKRQQTFQPSVVFQLDGRSSPR